MPTPADGVLRKVTLNLYEADVETLAAHYGRGWSSDVRGLINGHAELIRKSAGSMAMPRRKLGDFE